MRYFPHYFPFFPNIYAHIQIQSRTNIFDIIKMKRGLLDLIEHALSLIMMIYWTYTMRLMASEGFSFEKRGENRPFFPGGYGQILEIPHG